MGSRSEDFKTGLVRGSFLDGLFDLKTDDWGKKNWTATLLIPKSESLAIYEKAALEAATAEWGDKARQMIKDKIIKSPFLDGDGPQGKSKKSGEPHNGFPGNHFIRVKSGENYRPTVIDERKVVITDKSELLSGYYGYAVLHCFTWEDDKGGKGLTFGISMFQRAKKGEVLGGGGGVDVDKWAETIEDEGATPSSTKGGAGAGGLFG